MAHYYVDPLIQDLALETGGCVGDSLEMARFGAEHEAGTLVVAGVRFMGESAKILCPEKTVLMPDLEAECSLDLGCPEEAFSAFCDQHPDRTVVVYANTSAAVKARADWQKQAPDKEFIAAPTAGNGGSCKSCAFCPWMAMNSLGGIKYALTSGRNEILLDRKLGEAAKLPLQRMLDFAAGLKRGDVFNGMGPA